MGVPTSEVGYTYATARRGDHESSYEHVVALERKKHFMQLFKGIALFPICIHTHTCLRAFPSKNELWCKKELFVV